MCHKPTQHQSVETHGVRCASVVQGGGGGGGQETDRETETGRQRQKETETERGFLTHISTYVSVCAIRGHSWHTVGTSTDAHIHTHTEALLPYCCKVGKRKPLSREDRGKKMIKRFLHTNTLPTCLQHT